MYQWHDPAPDLSWETRQNLKSTCQRPACFVPDWWNSKLVVKSPDNKKNEELVNGCLFPPNMVIVGMNKHQTMIPMLRVSTPHVAPCCFKLHVHAEKDEGFEPRDFGAPRVHNKPALKSLKSPIPVLISGESNEELHVCCWLFAPQCLWFLRSRVIV